jgi:phage portal protein BeeE
MTLEGSAWLRGGTATDLHNFPVVFAVIAVLSLASALLFARLGPQAGAVLVRAH